MNAQIRIARILHVSAFWTLCLAILVVADVFGRVLFSAPVPGTKEILQNSIVTITFLQIPLAIYSGSMLRTTLFADALPPFGRRLLRTLASALGCALFVVLLWGTWPELLQAYQIGEYEGEGSLRVPTWPVRGAVGAMSAFAILAYAWMIVLDWRGMISDDFEAPGAIARVEN